MWVAGQLGEDGAVFQGDVKAQEKLDRALVAGLILEVVLDQPDLPDKGQARQRLVKTRIQDYLVRRLAGRVSLDRFRNLAQNLDGWFDFYYPLLAAENRSKAAKPKPLLYGVQEPQATYTVHEPRGDWPTPKTIADPSPLLYDACVDKHLENWIEKARPDIPHRSHRKMTPGKLKNFLRQSGGRWFRLRDFERFVQMDRKTAWDYLQQFLQTGLLCHNRKNSAAVRYCLAPAFLKVEADALRLAISLSLPASSEDQIEKIGDFLIATGGQSFPMREWEREFSTPQHHACLEELAAQEIVVWQNLPNGSRFLKIHHRWLKKESLTCSP